MLYTDFVCVCLLIGVAAAAALDFIENVFLYYVILDSLRNMDVCVNHLILLYKKAIRFSSQALQKSHSLN